MAKKSKEKTNKAKATQPSSGAEESSGISVTDSVIAFFGRLLPAGGDDLIVENVPPKLRSKGVVAGMCAAILVLAAIIYWQTSTFRLISLDDYDYVNQNFLVRNGFTWKGIYGSFTMIYQNFWIPVTWLSYMFDIQFWGMNEGAMHRTNTILYLANAIAFFFFLKRATGSVWRSFFVVLIWTAHPLRVESVAWVTERKDLLIGLFFMLALWMHVLWVQTRKIKWYALTLVFMLLGIMSKPTMMVLPAALLILDYWPLGRYKRQEGQRLIDAVKPVFLEKIPHFAFSFGCAAMTYYTQITINPIAPKSSLSNISVAANGYWKYLERTFWITDIMFAPASERTREVIVFSLFTITALLAISLCVWLLRKRAPELLFGWVWFLVV
ncbi:glycosyltransferase family 39 protein, partial [bacterium]